MKIAIVNLCNDIRTIGALNVSTFLRHNGYGHTFIYFLVPFNGNVSEKTKDGFLSFLRSLDPEVVAFSLTTRHFHIARDLTVSIKNILPSALTIWGGIHPTAAPEECLNFCDIVCLGEGEEPFLELVRKIDSKADFRKIENLWIRQKGVT